jgi:hypothetical protein
MTALSSVQPCTTMPAPATPSSPQLTGYSAKTPRLTTDPEFHLLEIPKSPPTPVNMHCSPAPEQPHSRLDTHPDCPDSTLDSPHLVPPTSNTTSNHFKPAPRPGPSMSIQIHTLLPPPRQPVPNRDWTPVLPNSRGRSHVFLPTQSKNCPPLLGQA